MSGVGGIKYGCSFVTITHLKFLEGLGSPQSTVDDVAWSLQSTVDDVGWSLQSTLDDVAWSPTGRPPRITPLIKSHMSSNDKRGINWAWQWGDMCSQTS